MRHSVRNRVIPVLALKILLLFSPTAGVAQDSATDQRDTDRPTSEPDQQVAQSGDEALTFLDAVTVTATLSPMPVQDTAGTVSIIDDETIQERLVQDFADLVKYEPGVYVENNVTRLGLNGFNIRGIGGNRVLTQVDGVQTAEQFAFGPFSIHQSGLDVDALKSVEIVRSANSALYGSDALGGVVSLFTKDPSDYLGDRGFHLGTKTTWDGRANELSGQLALAAGTERVQGSLFASVNRGHEIGNQGVVAATDDTRTVPNPQDVAGSQLLAKLVATPSPGNMLRTTAEIYDTRVETEWFSDRTSVAFGSLRYDTLDSDAFDTQSRLRVSFDHTLAGRVLDHVSWRVHGQANDTSQIIDRERLTLIDGALVPTLRRGTLDYQQVGYGGSVQIREQLAGPRAGVLLTVGGGYTSDAFDILRDRTETRAGSGEPVPTDLVFPTKYFPASSVAEAGAYVQAEFLLGRVTLVPGLRYDHFTLDADQLDPIYLAGLNPEAVDFGDASLSPKVGATLRLNDTFSVHGQYAAGFRAPPYSAINTGFTSLRGGYTTLPNPDLRAEWSENLELGMRGRLRAGEHRRDRLLELVRRLHRAQDPRRESDQPAAGVPQREPRSGEDHGPRAARRGLVERQRHAPRQLRAHRRRRNRAGRRDPGDRRVDSPGQRRPERGRDRPPLRETLGPLGPGALRAARGVRGRTARRGLVRAGRLRCGRPGGLPVAGRIAHVPLRLAQPDGREVLRVVERTGAHRERPGDRPLLQPRDQRRGLARLRLVAILLGTTAGICTVESGQVPGQGPSGGKRSRGRRFADYKLNRTSPVTVRRRMSPKICCWMLWLKRFVTLTSVVMAPPFHFRPKLPFTIV